MNKSGEIKFTDVQNNVADMNGDGNVDDSDIAALKNLVDKKETTDAPSENPSESIDTTVSEIKTVQPSLIVTQI